MDNQEGRRELVSKGVMGLLVGLSLLAAGFWSGRQLHIVWNTWPSTDGVVVRGAVQEVVEVPYAKGGMPIHRYTPKIEFRYTVSGRDYTTEAPSVYTADTYEKAAANLVRMYAPGTHHPIRYNPRDPRDIQFGIIDFGSLAFSFLLLIGGVVLSTVGLKSLVMGYCATRGTCTGEGAGDSGPGAAFRRPRAAGAFASHASLPRLRPAGQGD